MAEEKKSRGEAADCQQNQCQAALEHEHLRYCKARVSSAQQELRRPALQPTNTYLQSHVSRFGAFVTS